jgi:BirA family biotin operon repressor/biotin-[acetyl-CoA-carboxylase] ligase
LANTSFDRTAYTALLATRYFGHRLFVRAEVESTNDVAWEALAEGSPEGTAVTADAQTRGRGRAGRAWLTTPGKALALSIALYPGCERRQQGTLPLVAGLALVKALDRIGVAARLKWPNDVLIGERKLAGILCESRRLPLGDELVDVVVVGVGVNVSQQAKDFPADIAAADFAGAQPAFSLAPTSLAMEGHAIGRETVAAEFLTALEPLWTLHAEGGREEVLDAWTRRADFWGRPVTVRSPSGPVSGIARALDPDGALIVRLESGVETTVLAGDLDVAWPG